MNNEKQRKVIPLLKDISSRLWDGRAAVLVGSGFSRNAQPTSSSSRKFPMWNDLGDLFYEKIYCEKNSGKYSNVLKLADEVDAAFGRSALDKIILDNIPDKEYEPSELHKQLLNLPWTDVFTTNYDTLLERTCIYIDSKKYDIVVNKSDLINAEKPRIIKLHGSFPSERPFIITEEDYRCYPKKFSPFVNTVQQSLIENTLCLIGFSGDDPNFLNWIGWIRDNLDDKNSPKIYLISLSDFNEAQKKLLEKRNIIIIDLSLLGEFKGDHFKAHTAFLDFLNSNKKEEMNIDWPNDSQEHYNPIYHHDSQTVKKEKLRKALGIWKYERECYPGWCIAPEDNRKSLWRKTNNWINVFEQIQDWDDEEDLDVAYELTWRIKICLLPIFDDAAKGILKVIEKYSKLLIEKNNYPSTLPMKLPLLITSILRYQRQEGNKKEWNDLYVLALECKEIFTLLDESKLQYESVLFSYYNLNYEETFEKLSNWEKNELLPFMEAKRAGLLAELGHVDDATTILENSLNTLRKNNFITSKSNDFSSPSQEAYIMLLLYFIKRNNPKTLKSIDDAYNSRWAKLSQYKCDPKVELKILEIRIEGSNYNARPDRDNKDFDIGKRTTSLNFGFSSINKIVMDSFSFLIFCEEMALPPRIPQLSIMKNTFGKAAALIYDQCPAWGLFTYLRVGDENLIGNFFDRSLISKIGRNDVQESINAHFHALKKCQEKIKATGSDNSDNLYVSFMRCLAELLSRLITKSDIHKKIEIIEYISDLYNDYSFRNTRYLKRLLERTINSLSDEKKIENLPLFFKFPVKPLNEKIRPHEFNNPFLYLFHLTKKDNPDVKLKISKQDINNFISEIDNDNDDSRKISSVKMIILYQLGYINQANTKKLIKSLWSRLDSFGFPLNVGYRKFYFIKNLYPHGIDTSKLMLRYIENFNFPISKKDNSGITINDGFDDYCSELNGSISSISFELEKINSIFLAMEKWFENDKELLKSEHIEIKDEIEKKFENITKITINIYRNFKDKFSKETNNIISRLLINMKDYGLRVTPAILLLNINDGSSNKKATEELCTALRSNEEKIVLDTLRSISELLGTAIDCSEILLCLSEKVKWNVEPQILNSLTISEKIIREIEFDGKDEFIKNICLGLERILHDQSNDKTKHSSYIESIEIKINAARVASCIYTFFNNTDTAVPKVVLDWKILCESSEEFDEVRNSWNN